MLCYFLHSDIILRSDWKVRQCTFDLNHDIIRSNFKRHRRFLSTLGNCSISNIRVPWLCLKLKWHPSIWLHYEIHHFKHFQKQRHDLSLSCKSIDLLALSSYCFDFNNSASFIQFTGHLKIQKVLLTICLNDIFHHSLSVLSLIDNCIIQRVWLHIGWRQEVCKSWYWYHLLQQNSCALDLSSLSAIYHHLCAWNSNLLVGEHVLILKRPW